MPNLKADPPITVAIPESNDWMEIVGVVGDALDDGLGKPVKPGIYVPYTHLYAAVDADSGAH